VYLPWEKPKPAIPPARVIAEIGGNHMGSLDIAKELVRHARLCGAYAVKFQKRCVKELLSPEEYEAPHPNPTHSFGATYGAHREFLEFTAAQHAELKQFCAGQGIVYATSVWDVTSAREIIALQPEFIKVPSAQNNNRHLLTVLRDEYNGPVHVSCGMSEPDEIDRCVALFEAKRAARDRLVLYSCTSGYPVPHHEVALLDIRHLHETYGKRVHSIGFSGHHLGIALDVVAFTLKAEWIERHFTLDRTWKGTDQAASLEPDGLRRLVRDLEAIALAWHGKPEQMLATEATQRQKLKHKGA
jgi:sialic acid synthase